MGREDDLRLLSELLDSRMKGLSVCNEAIERQVPRAMEDLMADLRDTEAELISRLQRAIEALMEET